MRDPVERAVHASDPEFEDIVEEVDEARIAVREGLRWYPKSPDLIQRARQGVPRE